MDEIDRTLILNLVRRGRMTHEQLGQAVSLARPTVHERLRRLETQGIIRGYHAEVDWEALGYPLTAFIWVSSRAKSDDTAAGLLALNPAGVLVESVHGVTGEWCLLVKVRLASPASLKGFIDSIYTIEGVQNTMTVLSLAAYHEEQQAPRIPGDQP